MVAMTDDRRRRRHGLGGGGHTGAGSTEPATERTRRPGRRGSGRRAQAAAPPPPKRSRGGAALTLVAGALGIAALVLPTAGTPAAAAPPQNTGEPAISGSAEQGRTLSASRGSWSGGGNISYAYRWVRCGPEGGLPDGSDCTIIGGATSSKYVVAGADVGLRLRVRVTATNADGSKTAASNPTAIVVGPPVPTSSPSVKGSMLVGSTVTADPGTWRGRQPITFSFAWLRCDAQGGRCTAIGTTSRTYRISSADVGHRLRFNVTARNAVGARTELSGESPVAAEPLPAGAVRLPTGEVSIPATSVPRDQRLIVSEVRFSPRTITNRKGTIVVSVRVRDTRNFVVRDAFVFIRSTPKVTTGGDRRLTTADGWLSYELVPEGDFPTRARTAVQFFVKAYRAGDPSLAGVYGSRLVQLPVRLR
jgi:hypothetical protein